MIVSKTILSPGIADILLDGLGRTAPTAVAALHVDSGAANAHLALWNWDSRSKWKASRAP